MPYAVGYEHWHEGATDTPADYAVKPDEEALKSAKGTYPKPTGKGSSSVKNAALIATKNTGGPPVKHGQ